MIEDVRFYEVVEMFSEILYEYNKLNWPNKSNEFYRWSNKRTFNGIMFDNGYIYVKKNWWNPFSWVYIGVSDGLVEGVPDCVKVQVERMFIEQSAKLQNEINEIMRVNNERENQKDNKKLSDLKKLTWLCK